MAFVGKRYTEEFFEEHAEWILQASVPAINAKFGYKRREQSYHLIKKANLYLDIPEEIEIPDDVPDIFKPYVNKVTNYKIIKINDTFKNNQTINKMSPPAPIPDLILGQDTLSLLNDCNTNVIVIKRVNQAAIYNKEVKSFRKLTK